MRKEVGMAVAFAAMCLFIGLSNSDFYGQANVANLMRQIAMLSIFAIGSSFVIIAGGIDLSVGSLIGLTGVIIARISAPESGGGAGAAIWIGISIAMGVALLVGCCQGWLITRLQLQPFIVTLSGMLLLRGVSQSICHGGTISLGAAKFRDLADHGLFPIQGQHGTWYVVPYSVALFLLVAIVFGYLLHFTVFGRHVFAIGGNREAAKYSGVPVRRVEMMTYVISSGLAGLAGVMYAAYVGQMSHNVGTAYELLAIAATVLGGCSLRGGEGSIPGVIIGSAIMQTIENGINMFKVTYTDSHGLEQEWRLDTNWRYAVIGAVILAAVILDQLTHLWRQRQKTRHTD